MQNPPPATPLYLSRRRVLASAAGGAMLAGTPLLGGCVTGGAGGSNPRPAATGNTTADNPLGVPADASLEVVIFDGGYGDEYARFAEDLYQQRFPDAAVEHRAVQRVGEVLQPRFVAGNPPDVVNNSGAGRLDAPTLVSAGQLLDLSDLLDAPSYDDPAVPVRDTLLPGVVDDGSFDGAPLVLNLTYTTWGIWYSRSLFDSHGWTYPQTWAQMLDLCEEIRDAGIAPWTWQGMYPEYMNDPLLSMAAKAGGLDLILAVDNLEPDAWRHEALLQAAEAMAELAGRGYIMAGSEALSHTEAQNAWSDGQAAFIPCGSWLESEQQGITPEGFDMVMAPTPALTSADAMPVTAVQAASSEPFVVPAQAANPRGGLEFLRTLFSVRATRNFADLTSSLPAVRGATDGLTLTTGLQSVSDAVAGADTTFIYRFRGWYGPLSKEVDDATGELLAGRVTPAQWGARIQRVADQVAADDSITKYQR